ncbi:CAAX protease self-immunity [Sanguibacter gelidistatuariae]|uniref:CAAX protease self-immunity n=2 Tax=Sanguibacter gelidistatuariae TaxID=1814289 RepID=A0A1G6W8Z8_9MICO|nr:CAAX protease self-immunity [Sanguibacter gelidistatuariae]
MPSHLSHLQNLSPAPLVVAALVAVVVALVIHEPVSGKRSFAAFLRAEKVDGEPARLRFYRSWILQGCATAALAIGLVLALPGVSLADIGFRATDLNGLDRLGLSEAGIGASEIAGMITGAAVAAIALSLLARRRAKSGNTSIPAQMVAVQPMLPRTGRGRWGWAALSLSAGVTEEITYRGLLVLALAVALPARTPTAVIVVVAAVLFGAAHWYQGRAGMLATGVAGAALTMLYLGTGSLLVPIILHTLMDLRALLLPAGARAQEPETAAERAAASGMIVPAQTARETAQGA